MSAWCSPLVYIVICQCVYLPVLLVSLTCLYDSLSVTACLFVCQSTYLSVSAACLPVCQSLSVYLSVSFCLFTCLSVSAYIHVCLCYESVCLSQSITWVWVATDPYPPPLSPSHLLLPPPFDSHHDLRAQIFQTLISTKCIEPGYMFSLSLVFLSPLPHPELRPLTSFFSNSCHDNSTCFSSHHIMPKTTAPFCLSFSKVYKKNFKC